MMYRLEGGTLFTKLSTAPDNFSESDARDIVKQLLEAVNAVHSKDFVHRAIQPYNIMFSDKNRLKLIGFTISASVKDAEKEPAITGGDASFVGMMSFFPSPPHFSAPEGLNQQHPGKPSDIWAVGVITFIVLTGKKPFREANTIKLYNTIRQGNYDISTQEWSQVSNEAKDFIKTLLTVDPEKRPTASQALTHAWFKVFQFFFLNFFLV